MFVPCHRAFLSIVSLLVALLTALFFVLFHIPIAHAASFAQANGQNLQLVEQLSLDTRHIAVSGKYAYLVTGAGLVVLDISNTAAPVYLNTIALSDASEGTIIADDMLYIVGYYVNAFSISDPLYPVKISTLYRSLLGSELVAKGKYIYVPGGEFDDFAIVDMAKPASPLQVASYTYPEGTANSISSLAVQGNYVYLLSSRARGLLIIDISDPSKPQFVSRLEITVGHDGTYRTQARIVVAGETVYLGYKNFLADSHLEELALIDVSNPLAPKLKGKITVPSESDSHLLRKIEVKGNYVYWGGSGVPSRGDSIIQDIKIVNVTDPEHLSLEQTLAFDSVSFVIAENRLYNVSQQHGLQIFDLSIPATPTLISHDILRGASFESLLIRDNFLYSTGSGQLQVRDLSKSNMSIVGSLAIRGGLATFNGNTAYLNWVQYNDKDTCYGYHIVDVTNPFSPTLTLTHQFGCSAGAIPLAVLAVADQRLYASNYGEDRLYIYDLTVPDTPTLLGTYERLGGTILVNGQYAYLGGGAITGMVILDVSGATTPTVVSVHPEIGPIIRFIKRDSYLFALNTLGVTVFDITNPISPVVIGVVNYYGDRGYAVDFALEGDYIYMNGIANVNAVKVFDITDLTQPTEVASYFTGHSFPLFGFSLVATTDHKLYMPEFSNSLAILQLSGSISGKIVDSFGKPHAGVKLSLNNGQSTETNAQGDYSFASLIPGSYTVKAESPTYDFQPAEQTLHVPSYSSDATNFTLLLKPLSTAVTPDAPTHLSYIDLQGNVLDVDLPRGTVTQPTTVTVLPQTFASVSGEFFTGVRFDLQTSEARSASSNFTFTAPLTITIHYIDSAVAPVTDRDQLMLRWWDGGQWVDATTTCSDATPALGDLASRVLTTTVCQSGQFALFGPTIQHFLPSVSRSQVATSELSGRFVAQHSGKCLNVLDESQQNGANIDQMACDNRDSEVWTIRPQGDYVQLAAKHSQKCLRVADAAQTEGALVVQWSCTGADNELWSLLSVDDNLYQLVAKHSNQCLTVQNAAQENKAQLIQSNCSENQNQTWRFQPLTQ